MVHKNKNYSTISIKHLRDKNLSLEAVGLLSIMQAASKEKYTTEELATMTGENIEVIETFLNELCDADYITRD